MERTILVSATAALILGFGLFGFANQAGADLKAPIPTAPTSAVKILKMRITAYASTPEETSDHPFITASGKYVRDGIVASNRLPFGTKIKIPKLFGNKIFVVEDRMSRRFSNTIDIWMKSKLAAINFGVARAEVIVLENGTTSSISEAAAKGKNL